MRPILVGFAGGSGSGKSTLVQALVASMGDQCVHVVHDRYYRSLTADQLRDVSSVNFDEPNALDNAMCRRFDADEIQGWRVTAGL